MKKLLLFLILWSLPLMSQGRSTVHTTRRCTSCLRDKYGHIKRSRTAIRSFKKQHPCPVTGKTAGRCPGYIIDHVKPLECGGTDAHYILDGYAIADEYRMIASSGELLVFGMNFRIYDSASRFGTSSG